LRYIDKDVRPASGQLFGVGNDLLEQRRKAGGPRTRGAQRKPIALYYPLQCRITFHDANSSADSPLFMEKQIPTRRDCL
jgi:hypothetical protein